MSVPVDWNMDQINTFQRYLDGLLSGNLGARRKLRFVPGDFKYQEAKPPQLKDAYDEFLARIICFVFSVSPEPFVSHVNRATAESSQSRATDEGLAPLQRYVRGIMNRIIKHEFNSPDLEFVWQDTREQDPKDAASIDVAYVSAGIMTVNEVRAGMGLPPVSWGNVPAPAPVKKNFSDRLRKEDGEDDDEEDDEEDDDDEEDGESGSEGDGENDDDTSDFNAKHPRWPAGSPDGTGGEFAPKDGGASAGGAATTSDTGSISADQIKTPVSAPANKPATADNTYLQVSGEQIPLSSVTIQPIPTTSASNAAENPSGYDISVGTWGNFDTLSRHVDDHAADFGIDPQSPNAAKEYASQANQFLQNSQEKSFPTLEENGYIRIYDPESNTFGSYNPDGTTRTFFKPVDGTNYFSQKINDVLASGGKLTNALPNAITNSVNSTGNTVSTPEVAPINPLLEEPIFIEEPIIIP